MPYFYSGSSELGNNHFAKSKGVRRAGKTAAPKKIRLTKTKTPSKYSLAGANAPGVLSTTVMQAGTNRNGVGAQYNPMSITGNYVPPPPPLTVVSTTAKTSKLSGLMGLASQIISGILPHPTVQTADGQVPIYNTPNNQAGYQPNYQPNPYPVDNSQHQQERDLSGGAGADVGASLGSGFDGIIEWASNNPLIVAGFGFGAYLLFRPPPKYGNR